MCHRKDNVVRPTASRRQSMLEPEDGRQQPENEEPRAEPAPAPFKYFN